MTRRHCPGILAAGLLCLAGCSSSAPASRRHATAAAPASEPVSDPAATAARISGDWQIAIERGGRTTEGWLHFALNAGILAGSLTGEDKNSREISKITLKGDRISWVVEGEAARESYEGMLKGSSMEGTLKRSRGGSRRGGGSEGEEGSSGRGGGGSGGRRGGRGGGGGGRGGGGGGIDHITWRAFRSVPPAAVPSPEPTRAPQG